MSKITTLGVPSGALLAFSLACAFAACSGDHATVDTDPRDSSADVGLCTTCNPVDSGKDGGGSDDGASRDGNTNDGGPTDAGPTDAGPDAQDAGRDSGPETDAGGTVVRIMASNLTSGNKQEYLDPGIHILQGLKPDIALIQEFKYGTNTEADIRSFVDTTFGANFSYFRESSSGAIGIPNGIVSRYPMLEKGEWEDTEAPDRDFAWAKLDIPGDTNLWVISVHLLSGAGPTARAKEATALEDLIRANIPASDYVVLGGDFNTDTRAETCVTTFGSSFVTAAPYPADGAGNEKTNANRNKPYDWVLANPRFNGLAVGVQIGAQAFANGLVFDSRVYSPLTDVAPVKSDDSAATGMQHMAVVRDFRVP